MMMQGMNRLLAAASFLVAVGQTIADSGAGPAKVYDDNYIGDTAVVAIVFSLMGLALIAVFCSFNEKTQIIKESDALQRARSIKSSVV